MILAHARLVSSARESRGAIDLLDAQQVASALELRGEPDPGDCERFGFADGALPDREDISVVVGPVPDGELLVPTHAATDSALTVGDNRFAVSRSTEHDPALEFPTRD